MLRISQIAFSIGLIGLALIGLTHQDFCIIVAPDKTTQLKWLYTAGNFFVIAGGLLVIIKRFEFAASLVCAVAILVFSYILKIVPVLAKSSFLEIINSAESWETLALIGGSLILASTYRKSTALFNSGLALVSIWFLWAGIGHFEYLKYVQSLIPDYIPFPLFWTYFCAVCLMLTSIGVWIPKLRVLTATLACIMLSLWCVMLHIPNYFSHQADITRIMGIYESLSFAAIMGIVAAQVSKQRNK